MLTHNLLVNTAHLDYRYPDLTALVQPYALADLELDPRPWRDLHRMRIADLQTQFLAGKLGSVTSTIYFQNLLEAFGYTLDHIGDERPGETM